MFRLGDAKSNSHRFIGDLLASSKTTSSVTDSIIYMIYILSCCALSVVGY